MDERLLDYYQLELRHLRDLSAEFADDPAHRDQTRHLRITPEGCADPFVERLLEGFAYLAARVHLKFDSQFPAFTQSILEAVYPSYLAPVPSMLIAQFEPAHGETGLQIGHPIPRGSRVHVSSTVSGTRCPYLTSQPLALWPIKVSGARYVTRDLANLKLPDSLPAAQAAIALRLQTTGSATFDSMAIPSLRFYLHGNSRTQLRLYKQIFGDAQALIIQPAAGAGRRTVLDASTIRQVGFEPEDALLPRDPRNFDGYRLIQEYFAYPRRFLFAELSNLRDAFGTCGGSAIDILVPLAQADPELERGIREDNFRLFCTPAVNLFERKGISINLGSQLSEFQIIADVNAPADYEIRGIARVVSPPGKRDDRPVVFEPFYSARDLSGARGRYFTANRVPSQRRRPGVKGREYPGTELYVSLVDAAQLPYRDDLGMLSIDTWCTNRDLPLYLNLSGVDAELSWEQGGLVQSVRCDPDTVTPPLPSYASGPHAWRVISHLTLNYLSLCDNKDAGAAALRDLLRLYGPADPSITARVEGIVSVSSAPVTARLRDGQQWPMLFARGLDITLTLAEDKLDAGEAFLLGSVLEQFLARYVSINSFTRTMVVRPDKTMVKQWPMRVGRALAI